MSGPVMTEGVRKMQTSVPEGTGLLRRTCSRCRLPDERGGREMSGRGVMKRETSRRIPLSARHGVHSFLLPSALSAFTESRTGRDFSTVRARSEDTSAHPADIPAMSGGLFPGRESGHLIVPGNNYGSIIRDAAIVHAWNNRDAVFRKNPERPPAVSFFASLTDTATEERVGDGNPPVPMPVPVVDDGGGSPAPSRRCTYTVEYSNPRILGCDSGKCGAKTMFDITRVRKTGPDCPESFKMLIVSEKVTKDNGCGRGEFRTGNGCRIGDDGTVRDCTDTYGVCGPATALPSGECTETFTQKLYIGGAWADTRIIRIRITNNNGICTGAMLPITRQRQENSP